MGLRFFSVLFAGLGLATASAQPECVDEKHCLSQLLRVEVSNSILNHNTRSLLPVLQNFASSDTLPSMIEKPFPLRPISFPQNIENCEREKRANNPEFSSLNCSDPGLCGRPDLSRAARAAMCFSLPCPLLEGTLNVGKCNSETNIFPNQISFPSPVSVDRIRMSPTKVEFENGQAKLCFKISELSLSMSMRLGLDTRGTQLPDDGITVSNITTTLDGPREVCVSSEVDLGSPSPVKNISITTPDNTPFISDNMIRTASQNLGITGLSGYPTDQLQRVQAELVPVIFQPLRQTVEDSLKKNLASVFEKEVNLLAGQLSGTSSHLVSTQGLSSELGLANLQVRNQLAITECAALKGAGKNIPPGHACLGLEYFGKPIDQDFSGSASSELMALSWVARDLPITSESIKQRLIAMREDILNEKDRHSRPEDHPLFRQSWKDARARDVQEHLDPLIERISKNQLESQILSFIEIQNQLQSGSATRSVGVSVPEICSDKNPSPHARRSMPNCPVQAYVDLREMNLVLDRMWKAGRLCHHGRGEYVPTLEGGVQKYDAEGRPLGNGCYFEIGGMGCYLNNPPQITFDARTKKYKTSVNLKACYRPPVLFGIGRLGGEFNIEFSFIPKACNGGDFCMDNPNVNWSVVPGTERFAMRPSSLLNSLVTTKIDQTMSSAIGDTIRLPMASGVGPLANVPLEAEGRVDTGPEFFGACLRLRGSGVSGQ